MKLLIIEELTPVLAATWGVDHATKVTVSVEFQHVNGTYVDTGLKKNDQPVFKFIPAKKRYTKCIIKLAGPNGYEIARTSTLYMSKNSSFNRKHNNDETFTRCMRRTMFDKILTKEQRTMLWNAYWAKSNHTQKRCTNFRHAEMKIVHSTSSAA